MEIFSGFLVTGLSMILIGAILIFISLRASPRVRTSSQSTKIIESIQFMVNGRRVWILTALIISALLITYLIARTVYPNSFGGIISG
jgi:hypothetical protein